MNARKKSSLFAIALLAALSAARLATADSLAITLKNALPFSDPKTQKITLHDLQLDIPLTTNNQLLAKDAWAFTPVQIGQEHLGHVTSSSITGDKISATLSLAINHNRLPTVILGGHATIQLQLTRSPDNKITGTYTVETQSANSPEIIATLEKAWGFGREPGNHEWAQPLIKNKLSASLQTSKTTGNAEGTLAPDGLANLQLDIAAGQHPRLLFTQKDLPALRARAATPQGQKLIAQMKAQLELADTKGFAFHDAAEAGMGNIYAAGWGLLYQLTGDKSHAKRALQLSHSNLYGQYWYGGWWVHNYTLMGLALTYDLCYEPWGEIDPAFRDMIHTYLQQNIRDMAMRHDAADMSKSNQRYSFANDHSNFVMRNPRDGGNAKLRASAAIAALAILNDPTPAYKPTPLNEVKTLPPATDYRPWVGVPVVNFESDKMPREWLVNGPFLRGTTDEIFAPAGGLAKLRPEPGDTLLSDGIPVDWRRYLPNGFDNPLGPAIYVRVCGVNWGSGTGGGYGPGIQLQQKWRPLYGRRLATNVVLYTVLKNDRPRVIQACPNWRSASIGNRMWINSTPVNDGDLLRLEKGLYPITVDVQLVGGYSAQAPKLREYTQREYDEDFTLYQAALASRNKIGVSENLIARDLVTLSRSLKRYLPADVGPTGWGLEETQESLVPFAVMLKNVTTGDIASDSPLHRMLELAIRMRGHADSRTYDFRILAGSALLPKDQQPLVRWYLDTYDPPTRRPMDALLALATNPFDIPPQPPEKTLKKASFIDGYGIHSFRSDRSGSRDSLVNLDSFAPLVTGQGAGNLYLHALGRAWINARDPDRFRDANTVSIANFVPTLAKTLDASYSPDGSGSATIDLSTFREFKIGDNGKDVTLGAENKDLQITRHLAVDYSAKSGAPALLILADTLSGAAYREKTWRFDIGNVGFGKLDPKRITLTDSGFIVHPGKNDRLPDASENARMTVSFLSPPSLGKWEFAPRSYNREGTMFILEAKLERNVKRLEKVAERGPDELKGTGVHDDLLDDIHKQDKAEKRKVLPPVTVFTVITLTEGAAPKVELNGDTLKIGSRSARFVDGKIVWAD